MTHLALVLTLHFGSRKTVILHKGADTDAEQLALTEQLFDAALGELGVVARGQP